jgi:hypothetical protein
VKVYVVTSGCYSDYTIIKIFTDRQKAEEYKEWVIDANDVEEYDTADDLAYCKYYKVIVSYTERTDNKNDPLEIRIEKCLQSDMYIFGGVAYSDYSLIPYTNTKFVLTMVRFIPEQNWNEEFYRNKYTKAMYDNVAIAKQKRLEGWSEKDIRILFNNKEDD